MDALLEDCTRSWLLLGTVITSCFLFCFIRRIKACSKNVEKDLKKSVSENRRIKQSAKVLYVEFDRHGEKEERPIWIEMSVPVMRERSTSGLNVEYTAEMKCRVNEKGVLVCRPKLKKTVNASDGGVNAVQLS
ncbi:hypothetical protein T10_472, partial [Trichinella papuae]